MKSTAPKIQTSTHKGLKAQLMDGCFGPGVTRQWWFLLIVLLLGGWFWVWFFSGASLTGNDWPKEMSYWSIVKHSLTSGAIPWRSDQTLQQGTDRVLTIPEISYSPQVLLLLFLDLKSFVVTNLLILYAVGFWGCCKLAWRFGLSPFAFLFFEILFNGNGYLTSRFAMGHQMWEAVFFFPWFFYYIFDLLAQPSNRQVILKLALILFLILLQGGIHQYVWCNMFLALLFLFRANLRKSLLLIVFIAGLASSYRILPAAWECWNLQHPFLSGYPNLDIFVMALTNIGTCNTPLMGGLFISAGWWEYDIFIGLGGVLALVWFGILTPKINRHQEIAAHWKLLGLAALVFFFLSISDVYRFIHALHVPLLNSEAVSSRFIIITFFLLLLMSADALSRSLEKDDGPLRWVSVIVLVGTCYHLYLHAFIWRVHNVEQMSHAPPTVALAQIVGEPDSNYRTVIALSYLASFISIAATIFWWRKGLNVRQAAKK